jgi:hypothetical protein
MRRPAVVAVATVALVLAVGALAVRLLRHHDHTATQAEVCHVVQFVEHARTVRELSELASDDDRQAAVVAVASGTPAALQPCGWHGLVAQGELTQVKFDAGSFDREVGGTSASLSSGSPIVGGRIPFDVSWRQGEGVTSRSQQTTIEAQRRAGRRWVTAASPRPASASLLDGIATSPGAVLLRPGATVWRVCVRLAPAGAAGARACGTPFQVRTASPRSLNALFRARRRQRFSYRHAQIGVATFGNSGRAAIARNPDVPNGFYDAVPPSDCPVFNACIGFAGPLLGTRWHELVVDTRGMHALHAAYLIFVDPVRIS